MSIQAYQYDSKGIQSGILHIGVGNFHRAHQQFYTNELLKHEDQQHWGICGVCLLPSDEKIVTNLRSQDLDYTLTICGRDGKDEIYSIGSLTELIWGVEDPKAVINKIADPAIKIITLTITEGGYNLDKETNAFNLNDEKIKHDLDNPNSPTSVFGFVAEGLRKRKTDGSGSITILSCDNLQHNGNTAKRAFTTFIEAQDKELAEWVKTNVTFPNSMVDRITPATTPEDVIRLNEKSGTEDKAPVYCEDFTQWVIEDQFIAGRPAWEKVGVEFTQDVTAFENMKLSLLNASHTLLSYPSFLKGYRKVDEAMQDQDIIKLVRNFMDIDITPYVPAPENTDLEKYKQTLIERFSNHSVSDQVSRLCFDGISKFPVYILPNLTKMIGDDKDLIRIAFLFAAYRHYLKYKVDDKGHSYEVAEPWITENDEKLISSDDPIDFLQVSAFKSIDLSSSEKFTELYINFVKNIKNEGVTIVLQSL
ncbi:mannitol dehydrogenase family protein [Chryseobacterium sp. ERMR1:04]|uniref:mannitol dehydrogenase family protein n=1 Tax=Chryseobacterium sp. ERMR1:04 TaxID=1705393 RepID=UPI0006C8E052|nr:mannitol dehydrogenase family protein [Chryseobacterium sp. ERMR1:04]KPH15125.1 mannitol dehydrogenase [Chryseobacterium sp. ERMR1:04]